MALLLNKKRSRSQKILKKIREKMKLKRRWRVSA